MAQKMPRFSQNARQALAFAQEQAEALRMPQIGTDLMLLGLVRDGNSLAGRVLRSLGLDFPHVQELVQAQVFTPRAIQDRLDLAPETKKMLEIAVSEVKRLGHESISTEHLLRGLAQLEEGGAASILKEIGITTNEVRNKIDQFSSDESSEPL
jgi:ATP-dependent Clp protease ATP-binding subunit ClpC